MFESAQKCRESSSLELVVSPIPEAMNFQGAIFKQEASKDDILLRHPIKLQRINKFPSLPIIKILSASRDVNFNYQCDHIRKNPYNLQCDCDLIRIIDECLLLVEHKVLSIEAWYCVYHNDDGYRALLHLQIRLHSQINFDHSAVLKKTVSFLYHLETCGIHDTLKYPNKGWKAAVESARNSTCRVTRCQTHINRLPNGGECLQNKHLNNFSTVLTIADMFSCIITPCGFEQMPIRHSESIRTKDMLVKYSLTDLPLILLRRIVQMLNAKCLASASEVCSAFQHLSYEAVPGLQLSLFPHQKHCLKWMLHRETKKNDGRRHPFYFPTSTTSDAYALDFTETKLVRKLVYKCHDCRGGLLSDEPGLGKTITMLALLLRTKGQRSEITDSTHHVKGSALRSFNSRSRVVQSSQLIPSKTTLIIVPDALVEHWESQITLHVQYGVLRTYVDHGGKIAVEPEELAAYDIVITTFSRLSDEWRYRRPSSALEERAPDRYGFDGPQRYVNGQIRKGTSPFLMVHWVRVVVDEGHKLGVQSCSYQLQMARGLVSDKRWVMTGTPTPNTDTAEDLKFLHGQLVFLRDLPLGSSDGKCWSKAIARPFEKHHLIACYRLKQLLYRIMIRHTKSCVQSVPTEPVRASVYIKAMPEEYAIYNAVASAVVTNIFLTNIDPKQPGKMHPDSLLNPQNRKYAAQLIRSLRLACAGACLLKITLSQKSYAETMDFIDFYKIEGDVRQNLLRFIRDAQVPGCTTGCGVCDRKLQLLIVLTCGHLVCAACAQQRFDKWGPLCAICEKEYDPEDLQRLQPGFELKWGEDDFISDIVAKSEMLLAEQNSSSHQEGFDQRIPGGISAIVSSGLSIQEPRRHVTSMPNSTTFNSRGEKRRLDFTKDFRRIWSSKACYVAHRIRDLNSANALDAGLGIGKRSTVLKVIVFSQFKEHIWRIRVSCAQQGIHCAAFITGLSATERQRQLKVFRCDPTIQLLCLTDVGAHGLDLSFVSHIFFADEIWDKSLADQVISRAYRIGAKNAVVVEQLVMCGSLEEILHGLNDKGSSLSKSTGGISHFFDECDVTNSSLRSRTRVERFMAHCQSGTNQINKGAFVRDRKSSRLRQRVDYLLDNLRLLEPNEVSDETDLQYSVIFEAESTSTHVEHHRTISQKSKKSGQSAASSNARGLPEFVRDQNDPQHRTHIGLIGYSTLHDLMNGGKGNKRKRVSFMDG